MTAAPLGFSPGWRPPKELSLSDRQSISKKLRFDVFKRDGFACQYCGRTPPTVVLEVDHIDPVANGGKNSFHNLITACFDCNRGKSDGLLSSLPETIQQKAQVLAERQAQVRAYERLIKASARHEDRAIDEVEGAFRVHFAELSFTPQFKQSVRIFVRKMPTHEVVNAMHIACGRTSGPIDATRYFCGICWKIIKGESHGPR